MRSLCHYQLGQSRLDVGKKIIPNQIRAESRERKPSYKGRGRVLSRGCAPGEHPVRQDRAAAAGAGGWSWSGAGAAAGAAPVQGRFAAALRFNSSPSAHPFSPKGRCFSVGTPCPRAMPPSPAGAKPGGFRPVPPVPTRFLPAQAQGAPILFRCFLTRQHLFPVPNMTEPRCWAAVTPLSPEEDEPVPFCCPCPAGARLSLGPGVLWVSHPFLEPCILTPGHSALLPLPSFSRRLRKRGAGGFHSLQSD